MSKDYKKFETLIHTDNEEKVARRHLALSVVVASLDTTLLDVVLWLEDRIYQADLEKWDRGGEAQLHAFEEVWKKIFGSEIDLKKLKRDRS